ncbi:MAG TPA: hypothetical protein VFX59_10405 [Polyangiales bacterium]|nr:hypothetical protein [Polyangiales bacterium]
MLKASPTVLRALAGIGLVLALGSCGTVPTLPLPPPVASVGTPSLQGLVTVEGQANDEAWVTVLNTTTEEGKIGRADKVGYFSISIEAQAGDKLDVFQEIEGVAGEHVELLVPAAP